MVLPLLMPSADKRHCSTPQHIIESCIMSFLAFVQASLKRLQVPSVGLYMIHWPGFALQSLANDAFVEGLARVKQAGLAQAVGVSNFREDRLRRAHQLLQVRKKNLCVSAWVISALVSRSHASLTHM